MNGRIRELYRQASDQAWTQACSKNNTLRPQNNTVWNEFVPLFAELIIKEYQDSIAKVWYEQDMDIRGADIVKFLEQLDKHFGVEE